jgi:hypothetical protein
VARIYTPFITRRNLLNQATKISQNVCKRKAYLLVLPSCAFDEGFKFSRGASDSVKWCVVVSECHDMKGKFVGPQLTSSTETFRQLVMNVICSGDTIFLADGQYPIVHAKF